jgi:two-component system, chemotaxis family, CheB/CheR fusion protein
VFPQLVANRKRGDTIRIWVPGCATGEEAYSVAIALTEFLDRRGSAVSYRIFATDLSDGVVERARIGFYPGGIATDVSAARLKRFFVPLDQGYQVSKSIRERCIFARQNVLTDPPFSKLDLISCRNVLIYFRPEYQRQAFSAFYFALKPTGYLLLGRSESAGASELFVPVMNRARIYRKKAGVAHPPFVFHGIGQPLAASRPGPIVRVRSGPFQGLFEQARELLLEHYGPPCVIVNDQFDAVQFRGRTSAFLEPAQGQATFNLIKMARDDFRIELQAALYEARKSDRVVRREELSVRQNGGDVHFNLEVSPLHAAGDLRFFAVIFEQGDGAGAHGTPAKAARRAGRLKAENTEAARVRNGLASTKRQLQTIIEELASTNDELKAANEEALSSNEELQSMNEELQTAKEELQSANEELTTLNDELHNRNSELGQVAADLGNLLASIDIPVVMLSHDLRIRRYTPAVSRVLNLMSSDVGRPIKDINLGVDIADPEAMLTEAMESASAAERQGRDRSGRQYTLRVQPVKTAEGRVDGVVMMLLEADGRPPAA